MMMDIEMSVANPNNGPKNQEIDNLDSSDLRGSSTHNQRHNSTLIKTWVMGNARIPSVNVGLLESRGAIIELLVGENMTLNLITNYHVLWNMLGDSDGDVFGDFVPFVQACAAFYLHRTTFIFAVCSAVYLMTLSILTVASADYTDGASIAKIVNDSGIIPGFVAFTLYLVTYRIVRGSSGGADGVMVSRHCTVGGIGQRKFGVEGGGDGGGASMSVNPLLSAGTGVGLGDNENSYIIRESVVETRRRNRQAESVNGGEQSFHRHMEAERTWYQLACILVRGNCGVWRRASVRRCCCCLHHICRHMRKDKDTADEDADDLSGRDEDDESAGEVQGLYQLLNMTAKFLLVHGRAAAESTPSPSVQIFTLFYIILGVASAVQMLAQNAFYFIFCATGVSTTSESMYNSTVFNETLQANVTTVIVQTETVPYFNAEFCQATYWASGLTCGYVLVLMYRLVVGCGVAVGLACIAYGTDLCHKMSEHWVDRITTLRLLTAETETEAQRDTEMDVTDMIPLIRADIIECFLFRQKLIRTMSKSFEMFIVVYEFCSIVSAASNIVSQMILPLPLGHFLVLVLIDGLYICFPLLFVAHANYAAEKMRARIFLSGKSDYSALGSREKWVEYMNQNASTWNVYGLAVTCKLCVLSFSALKCPDVLYVSPPPHCR